MDDISEAVRFRLPAEGLEDEYIYITVSHYDNQPIEMFVNYPYLNHWYYPYDYNYNRWNHTVHYDRSIGGNSINTSSSSIAVRKHTSNSVSKKAKIQ